ncbi:MAG: tail fiber domain-containing protein, partial [Candidatus Daviesbacteria bacterium]|nr:tail fiber domain-containing protein [Candidatus Daviesbacteria bacterium]
IGTTAPTSPVHIYTSAAAPQFTFERATVAGVGILFKNPSVNWTAGYSNTNSGFAIGPTAGVDNSAFIIKDTTGNIGIGTTAPGSKLGIMGAVGIGTTYSSIAAPANSLIVEGNIGIGTTNPARSLETTGSIRMGPLITGGGTAVAMYRDANGDLADSTSSILFKTDITPYPSVLEKVLQLNAVNFKWNDLTPTPGASDFGMIAEQVNSIMPDLVIYNTDGVTPHGLKYDKMGLIALKAIQELSDKVNSYNLTFDSEGNVILPKVKIDNLVIASDIPLDGSTTKNYFDVAAVIDEQIASNKLQDTNILGLQSEVASQSAALSSHETALESLRAEIASLSSQLVSSQFTATNSATPSASTVNNEPITNNDLDLTPPSILLATTSAQLVDLSVTSEATFSGKLTAYKATISDTFKSLGNTFLGNTTVAGDFSVDGTLSLTGRSLSTLDTLYIQNGPLVGNIDFFNGQVIIDKTGKLTAQKIALPASVLGEALIPANTLEIPIFTSAVTDKSKVFLTPSSSTGGQAIILGEVVPGTGFVAKLDHILSTDIKLNWVIFDQQ